MATAWMPVTPASRSTPTAVVSVPPVSMMSSTTIDRPPADLADDGVARVVALGVEDRELGAQQQWRTSWPASRGRPRARRPPRRRGTRSRRSSASIFSAVMWSTGTEKKPWDCPVCRSTVSTRSAPTDSSIRATARALIGSRSSDFLSWRL